MRCTSCETDNAADNRFCVACGTALPRACPACSHANAPDGRFCAQCGVPLAGAMAVPQFEGELKQVTVLFADVSGSTSLIEGLDPEEAGRALAPAIEAMTEAVRRFEGSVVRVQGDGVMALFGAPNPQEDHAVRACCAALAMQETARTLPGGLAVRVGIHTGEVLARTVTTDFSTDFDATGITVHIANRLESLAPEGTIAVSAATLRAARHFVTSEATGRHSVRGLSAPLEAFRLTGVRRSRTSERFSREPDRGAFVGREAELALLERGLERAAEGDGCAIGVVAEAGVGKSRLCFEFAERCRARGVPILEGRALAHSRATPYEPVIDVVKAWAGIAADDPQQEARDKASRRLVAVDPALSTELPLMLDFLGLAEKDTTQPKVDPTVRREHLQRLFRRLIRAAGAHQPVLIMLEDLHFMDSGSGSLIEVLLEVLPGTHILLVVNYRPGYAAPWMHGDRFDQISLSPLRAAAADRLAARLLGGDVSVVPLLPLIADRARGNPLFIEELVRKFAESGNLAGEAGAYRLLKAPDMHLVPETVQAIIGARIDSRPEAEKSILQTASVIGREFAVPVLARLVGALSQRLGVALSRLTAAGLVYETGSAREGVYAFKHPMVQDVAYRSLLSERRRNLHSSVAIELEKTLPDAAGAQAGFIAYHWEEAGNAMQAASWNTKAAAWHGTRDPAQALDAWKRVRQLLQGLPLEGAAKYPLLLATGQIVNFAWRAGITASDVLPYYNEALDIAHGLGDVRAAILLTVAYGRVLAASGSAVDYVSTVSDVLSRLDREKHRSLYVVLTAILCHALRLAGDLRQALQSNEEALARVQDVAEIDQQTLGFDVGVWLRGMRAQTLAMMGRFDEARPLLETLLAADDTTVDTLHRLLAHTVHIDIAWAHNDAASAAQHSAAASALAERSGNPYLLVYARAYAGVAQAVQGDYSRAARTLSEALAYARERNAGLENEARMLADLALVQMRAGLDERARVTAEEAAAVARRRGAKVWLAYTEWIVGGPTSPTFCALVETSGAHLLARLPPS
jgi:adenylate cyclase